MEDFAAHAGPIQILFYPKKEVTEGLTEQSQQHRSG